MSECRVHQFTHQDVDGKREVFCWRCRLQELEAENKALIDANVEVANINAGLLVEVEALEKEVKLLIDGIHTIGKERDALVEAARAVVERHKRKVSLNGLLYYEYESEELEALAALLGTKGESE